MTIAEQLRRQGEQRGMELGRREVARKMIASGLDAKMICEMTGLTKSELNKLKS